MPKYQIKMHDVRVFTIEADDPKHALNNLERSWDIYPDHLEYVEIIEISG